MNSAERNMIRDEGMPITPAVCPDSIRGQRAGTASYRPVPAKRAGRSGIGLKKELFFGGLRPQPFVSSHCSQLHQIAATRAGRSGCTKLKKFSRVSRDRLQTLLRIPPPAKMSLDVTRCHQMAVDVMQIRQLPRPAMRRVACRSSGKNITKYHQISLNITQTKKSSAIPLGRPLSPLRFSACESDVRVSSNLHLTAAICSYLHLIFYFPRVQHVQRFNCSFPNLLAPIGSHWHLLAPN